MEIKKFRKLLQSLKDATTLKIYLELLDGSKTVEELQTHFGIAQSIASSKLKPLRDANLVKFQKKGKYVEYSPFDEQEGSQNFLKHCDDIFNDCFKESVVPEGISNLSERYNYVYKVVNELYKADKKGILKIIPKTGCSEKEIYSKLKNIEQSQVCLQIKACVSYGLFSKIPDSSNKRKVIITVTNLTSLILKQIKLTV